MSKLNETAKELLESGKVRVVVGYVKGTIPGKTQTFVAVKPEQTEKFIFNEYCVNNLATYLTKSYGLPKPVGIFVKSCDAKTIVALLQEKQIKREDVFIIGLPCTGVKNEIDGELSGKCRMCVAHNPKFYDIIIGEPVEEQSPDFSKLFVRVEAIENMSAEERWNFWQGEFEKCVRCYACRQVCPLCYCEQCITDKTQPRWIESSAHEVGNLSWHLIRAFHLAGRCIGCGECVRACHQNIPLGLLNMKMAREIFNEYGYRAGENPDTKPVLADFKLDDNQDFIM